MLAPLDLDELNVVQAADDEAVRGAAVLKRQAPGGRVVVGDARRRRRRRAAVGGKGRAEVARHVRRVQLGDDVVALGDDGVDAPDRLAVEVEDGVVGEGGPEQRLVGRVDAAHAARDGVGDALAVRGGRGEAGGDGEAHCSVADLDV